MSEIKLIVLDFHGIMVKGDYSAVSKMLAKKHHVPWKDIFEILYKKYFRQAVVGEIPERDVYLKTFRHFGWREDWKKVHAYHKNAMVLNRGIFKMARRLQDDGYTILLLTQNTPDQVKTYNKRFGLPRYFKHIVNTFDLGVHKSSPQTIKWILKKFKVKAEQVVFCDDQESNLVEPGKFGMRTVLYKNFKQFNKELTNHL